MNKKFMVYVLVVLIIVLGAYYFFKPSVPIKQNQEQTPVTQTSTESANNQMSNTNTRPNPINQNPTTQSAVPTQTVQTRTYDVSMVNFSFSPATLNIKRGDVVVWTNKDSAPHKIQGDNLDNLSGPTMGKEQTYSFTFNNTGTFDYHCVIHPSMKGSIVVK